MIIINVSPKLGIAAVTSSYLQTKQSSSAHTTARSPANPLTLWRRRYQHQGTLGLGLHYQTIFDALSSFHQTSPFSTFQASLHFKLTVVQVTPLSLAAGPAMLANAAQVSGLMEDMMTAVVITVEVMVISTKQTT